MGSSTHLRVGIDGLAGAYEQIESMNINWVREEIPWSEVEQTPGQFSWSYGVWINLSGLQQYAVAGRKI